MLRLADLMPDGINLSISTWTLFRNVAEDLAALLDSGKLASVDFLTGQYMASRDPFTFKLLCDVLEARGQRVRAVNTHAKIAVLRVTDASISVEGSANFTRNERIENSAVFNDAELAAFHAGWIAEMLCPRPTEKKGTVSSAKSA